METGKGITLHYRPKLIELPILARIYRLAYPIHHVE